MLISCLSCINRAASRRGSDRPEGYAGKCILYERGLQGGLRALPASPTFPPPLCQQPHGLWTSSGQGKSFLLGFEGHRQPPIGTANAKGVPPTPHHLCPGAWRAPGQGHLRGVTRSMPSQPIWAYWEAASFGAAGSLALWLKTGPGRDGEGTS